MKNQDVKELITKTNDIKEINKILRKTKWMDIPYNEVEQIKNMLVAKEKYFTQRYPSLASVIPYILWFIFLRFTFSSLKLIVLILEIIDSLLVRNLFIKRFPNLFTTVGEASGYQLYLYEAINFHRVTAALSTKKNYNTYDYNLSQEASDIAISKLCKIEEEKETKYNDVTNFHLKLVTELNNCLDLNDFNESFNKFLEIENKLKESNNAFVQDLAFKLLPEYFLLIIAKYPSINIKDILNKIDTYLLAIIIKYLCEKLEIIDYKKEYMFGNQKDLVMLGEALIKTYFDYQLDNQNIKRVRK